MVALRFCTSRSALLSGAVPRYAVTARRTAWRFEAPKSLRVRLQSSGKRASARLIEESSLKRCDSDPPALSARHGTAVLVDSVMLDEFKRPGRRALDFASWSDASPKARVGGYRHEFATEQMA